MEYSGYKIEHDGSFGYKEIKPMSKGSVPKQLRGRYTSAKEAMLAIDRYVEENKTHGNAKGRTGSK